MIDGIEHVDSFVFNPHKWLFTNFDCSAYFVRDPDALIRTFAIQPEYLKTAQDQAVINYRDWGIQLGRRFRALKLWFVIRSFGVDGLRDRIGAHIEMARGLVAEIGRTDDFEIVAPGNLALFCFRYHPPGVDDRETLDALNAALLTQLNDSGELYLSHTQVQGAFAIRFSIGQTETRTEHLARAWRRIQETARALEAMASTA
jgi:aromatic-L-amino-acid decarboxylase